MREPFFRKSRNCWYVKDSVGRFVRLDPDKQKAFDRWHRMVQSLETQGTSATILGIAESWLAAHDGLMAADAFEKCRRSLCAFCIAHPNLKVADCNKPLVMRWLRSEKPGRLKKDGSRGTPRIWSIATQRDRGQILQRVLRWAMDEGMISRNPLGGLRFQKAEPRSTMVDSSAHGKMVQNCLEQRVDRSFSLYLIASHCGARPQQIREVTAADVIDGAWVFQRHKTRGKTGKPLVVYLSPCLQTLTRILAAKNPKGPLFRNAKGEPWKKDTVAQRIRRLRARLKLPPGTVAYSYRHTFATDALLAGNSMATVAQLLGHTSTAMVAQVYGHLDQHRAHLKEAAAKTSKIRICSNSQQRSKIAPESELG